MNDTTGQTQPPQAQPPAKVPIRAGAQALAIIPQDFDECWRVATVAFHGGMVPSDCTSIENAMVRIMHGLEVGLPPMAALQSIAVINGRPTIWGDAAIAMIYASGKAKFIREFEELRQGPGDSAPVLTAVCVTHREGHPEPIERTWSVTDERVAGLEGKDIHKKFPKRMRQMRARAYCLRDTYADVLKGLTFAEELQHTIEHDTNEPMRQEAPRAGETRSAAPKPPDSIFAAKPADKPAEPAKAALPAPSQQAMSTAIEQPRERVAVGIDHTQEVGQEHLESEVLTGQGEEPQFTPPENPGEDVVLDWLNENEGDPAQVEAKPEPPKPVAAETPRRRGGPSQTTTGAEQAWLASLKTKFEAATDMMGVTKITSEDLQPRKEAVSAKAWSEGNQLAVVALTRVATGK